MKQTVFVFTNWREYVDKLRELNDFQWWIDITFYNHLEGGVIIAHKL